MNIRETRVSAAMVRKDYSHHLLRYVHLQLLGYGGVLRRSGQGVQFFGGVLIWILALVFLLGFPIRLWGADFFPRSATVQSHIGLPSDVPAGVSLFPEHIRISYDSEKSYELNSISNIPKIVCTELFWNNNCAAPHRGRHFRRDRGRKSHFCRNIKRWIRLSGSVNRSSCCDLNAEGIAGARKTNYEGYISGWQFSRKNWLRNEWVGFQTQPRPIFIYDRFGIRASGLGGLFRSLSLSGHYSSLALRYPGLPDHNYPLTLDGSQRMPTEANSHNPDDCENKSAYRSENGDATFDRINRFLWCSDINILGIALLVPIGVVLGGFGAALARTPTIAILFGSLGFLLCCIGVFLLDSRSFGVVPCLKPQRTIPAIRKGMAIAKRLIYAILYHKNIC
jgi:hypothetical protein